MVSVNIWQNLGHFSRIHHCPPVQPISSTANARNLRYGIKYFSCLGRVGILMLLQGPLKAQVYFRLAPLFTGISPKYLRRYPGASFSY